MIYLGHIACKAKSISTSNTIYDTLATQSYICTDHDKQIVYSESVLQIYNVHLMHGSVAYIAGALLGYMCYKTYSIALGLQLDLSEELVAVDCSEWPDSLPFLRAAFNLFI